MEIFLPQQTILFYGTEQFGAGMLQALIESKHWNIIGAVTQPDRPVGRRGELHESPVKKLALQHGIPVFQPESLKTVDIKPGGSSSEALPSADLQVVCQYGLIIPKRIVDAPPFGTINVHTSLLPSYRGASPIQTAIMHGATETGVTIMRMDEKMDHGGIIAQQPVAIRPYDTTPTLSASMMPVAQNLLVTTIKRWFEKTVVAHEQDHALATFCRQFEKNDGLIDFSLSARDIYNRFRAFTPWPGTFAFWNGSMVKFLKLSLTTDFPHIPAAIVKIIEKRILLGTITEPLEVIELQREGGKPLAAKDFIAGARTLDGATLQGKQKEGTDVPSL